MKLQTQVLPPEAVHLPDSACPDADACVLQDVDLATPGLDLLPAWSSGLQVNDNPSLVLAQGLDAWVQFEHPDDVSVVDGTRALLSGDEVDQAIMAPERSMPVRPGELSPLAQEMVQAYQQAVPSMYPTDEMGLPNDFSHRALRFGLLDAGLE